MEKKEKVVLEKVEFEAFFEVVKDAVRILERKKRECERNFGGEDVIILSKEEYRDFDDMSSAASRILEWKERKGERNLGDR